MQPIGAATFFASGREAEGVGLAPCDECRPDLNPLGGGATRRACCTRRPASRRPVRRVRTVGGREAWCYSSRVDPHRQLDPLVAAARADGDVLAVILHGSQARGDARIDSDVDVALVLTHAERQPSEVGHVLLRYASLGDADVQVFQRLPLYVQSRVLREGRVLFVRDEDALYEAAFRTVRAWELFRPRYEAYLAEVARGGS
jgi:hypothetical protein